MNRLAVLLAASLLGSATLAGPGAAAHTLDPASAQRNEPAEPFRISDHIYFVGTRDMGIFLIRTSAGLILLDAGFEETPPQILANIRKLGFDPRQVRVLLNSQAHADHAGGFSEIKRVTGARLMASAADARLIEAGGHNDPNFGNSLTFPPVKVDARIVDGQVVSLGGVKLTAHLTPGHTPGCTTWTMPTRVEGKAVQALFLCGLTAPGYTLVGNRRYPGIARDYKATFAKVRGLKCELFLGAHGSYFDFETKRARMKAGGSAAVFIDPAGCAAHIDAAEAAFRQQLAAQEKK